MKYCKKCGKAMLSGAMFCWGCGAKRYRPEFSIDGMDGHLFERFCAELLRQNGFSDVYVTRGSGDQGVDVIAIKEGIKYAIQCKNYAKPLSNKPVQEIHAGKVFYGCHIAVVMTNSTFRPSAVELAKATGVLLWNGNKVRALMQNVSENDLLKFGAYYKDSDQKEREPLLKQGDTQQYSIVRGTNQSKNAIHKNVASPKENDVQWEEEFVEKSSAEHKKISESQSVDEFMQAKKIENRNRHPKNQFSHQSVKRRQGSRPVRRPRRNNSAAIAFDKKYRRTMSILAWICFIFTVIGAFGAYSARNDVQRLLGTCGACAFFAIMGFMFKTLEISPRKRVYLFGKNRRMNKFVFIILCSFIGIILCSLMTNIGSRFQ